MSRSRQFLYGGLLTILLVAIPAGVIMVNQQQKTESRADSSTITGVPSPSPTMAGLAQANATPTPTTGAAGSCQTPSGVQNVQIIYPATVGNVDDFSKATCKWNAVSTAETYKLTVIDAETKAVIKNEQNLTKTTTEYVFPVTQGKTYTCEVFAGSACGTYGPSGTATEKCGTTVIAAAPVTPTRTPTTGPTVAPTTAPTAIPPTAVPVQRLACGYGPCTTDANCASGMTCVQASDGKSYCAISAYAAACKQSPTTQTCCSAPPLQPTRPPVVTIAPTGDNIPLMIGGVALGTILIGGVLFLLTGL